MSIGLYIHVPFCIKKCSYCDFVSYPHDAVLAASYVYALEEEMSLHACNMCGDHLRLESIYLGGGTPTTLEAGQLEGVLDACRRYFTFSEDVEITLECNPGTVDAAKLLRLRRAGFNRLSMGVQACQEDMLFRLGRIHTWEQVEETARHSRNAGFDNMSFDLIFGIPGQTMAHWKDSLTRITALSPQHISAYNLKIEPDTPLHRDVASGYLVPCDEDLELEMYWHTVDFLTTGGFEHYEISNFARPGRKARHNLIYWHNREYLGLGPAAHSMLNCHRFSNTESVELYIRELEHNCSPVHEVQRLTIEEQMAESVFLGLRLVEGLSLQAFEDRYGRVLPEYYAPQLKKLGDLGLIEINGDRLRLTDKGLPLANVVFAEFV